MIEEELETEDLNILTGALKSQITRLTLSGDYPEKDRDKKVLKKLLNLKYEMKKTGGYMIVISD